MSAVFDPAVEYSLILVKPDGYQRKLAGEIISRIEKRGFDIAALKVLVPTSPQLEAHYWEHKEKPFFPGLVKYMSSGPVVAILAQGNGVIPVFRAMMGATDPTQAAPGTIRGDFGRDWGTGEIINIVHGSDSPESAQTEAQVWFPELF